MITREQVADLQPGDVVDATVRATLEWVDDSRCCVRLERGGESFTLGALHSLTVVSRAVRPLYANHDRTEPVPGDVVRDADGDKPVIWMYAPVTGMGADAWVPSPMSETHNHHRDQLPARLRLLVDGETGMPPAVSR